MQGVFEKMENSVPDGTSMSWSVSAEAAPVLASEERYESDWPKELEIVSFDFRIRVD